MNQVPIGSSGKAVMSGPDVSRAISRIAHEIVERNQGAHNVVLVGLQRGGTWIADLLAERIPPTEIVRSVWEEISQKKTGSFEELYSPALRLKPLSHVSDLEFPLWVGEVCQSDPRRREVQSELIRQFSPGAPTEQQLKRLAHILVGANDVAGGNVVAASARLQEVLKVHRHTSC